MSWAPDFKLDFADSSLSPRSLFLRDNCSFACSPTSSALSEINGLKLLSYANEGNTFQIMSVSFCRFYGRLDLVICVTTKSFGISFDLFLLLISLFFCFLSFLACGSENTWGGTGDGLSSALGRVYNGIFCTACGIWDLSSNSIRFFLNFLFCIFGVFF